MERISVKAVETAKTSFSRATPEIIHHHPPASNTACAGRFSMESSRRTGPIISRTASTIIRFRPCRSRCVMNSRRFFLNCLVTVPDGTPLPGYTKVRSNLVTSYTFSEGALTGFTVGGALQYRDKGYRGDFDLNRDGTPESIWTPGYTLGNLIFGYRTKLLNRRVDFRLNIHNVLDKTYYRASGLMSGLWGEGRTFRLTTRIDL